jgi:hypothetical protein
MGFAAAPPMRRPPVPLARFLLRAALALVAGDVAFREDIGAHTDVTDWLVFLEFAARYFTAAAGKN